MSDFCDDSQLAEALFLAEALSARQAPRAASAAPSLAVCAACGRDIPEARRRAVPGCTRCAACQAEAEA